MEQILRCLRAAAHDDLCLTLHLDYGALAATLFLTVVEAKFRHYEAHLRKEIVNLYIQTRQ